MLVGRGRGGRMRTRLSDVPPDLVAASSRRVRYWPKRAMSPLMRSCGPVRGTSCTSEVTSNTESPLSTPSLKSSKKSSFTGPSPSLVPPGDEVDGEKMPRAAPLVKRSLDRRGPRGEPCGGTPPTGGFRDGKAAGARIRDGRGRAWAGRDQGSLPGSVGCHPALEPAPLHGGARARRHHGGGRHGGRARPCRGGRGGGEA